MDLNCRNLAFTYPGTDAPVFSDLSFSLALPGFHALFGPSGVGKTSLANILSGSVDDFAGSVELPPEAKTLYTFNTERLPGWSSVGRHLEKVCDASRRAQLMPLAECFGVSACLDRRFPQLSLGQKNRVNLLRYLMQDFHILILDESLANVDESTRERIIFSIKAVFPERGFLYISHNIVEVARFCNQIVVLRGAGKTPSAMVVTGLDARQDQHHPPGAQDRVMLEIMNAV